MVRSIGVALERAELGEAIARDVERRAERVRRAAEGRPRVRFAYMIWRKPWMSVNADTFASALLELAGGANVFGDRPVRYPEVTADAVGVGVGVVVLVWWVGLGFEERHADELARATGLPRERFALADGEYLSWHGSRTPDGIDYAAGLVAAARARRG
jgi:ABC-type Fe3+-hydroxamate transport system substrate-binding protein